MLFSGLGPSEWPLGHLATVPPYSRNSYVKGGIERRVSEGGEAPVKTVKFAVDCRVDCLLLLF